MAKRIIGQCRYSDFIDVITVAVEAKTLEEIESFSNNLTSRQQVAMRIIYEFQQRNIPLRLLPAIREVLVWDTWGGRGAQYKYNRNPDKQELVKELQRMLRL